MESGAVLVRDPAGVPVRLRGGPDHSLQRWAGRGEGGVREGMLGALCLTGGRGMKEEASVTVTAWRGHRSRTTSQQEGV